MIVLASLSPRRRKLLRNLGVRFKIIPSQIDEEIDEYLSPQKNVLKIAVMKALEVAKKAPRSVIIAADTLVVLKGKPLGKPKNKREAEQMLMALSNNLHEVVTGLVVWSPAKKRLLKKVVTTKVKFRKLTKKMIKSYLSTAEYLDKAGTYAIQEGKGPLLVESVEGEYFNIVGLPVYTLSRLLEKLGINLMG